jgi:hypothetical protein
VGYFYLQKLMQYFTSICFPIQPYQYNDISQVSEIYNNSRKMLKHARPLC